MKGLGFGFEVWGLGFRVWGLGFGVWGTFICGPGWRRSRCCKGRIPSGASSKLDSTLMQLRSKPTVCTNPRDSNSENPLFTEAYQQADLDNRPCMKLR